MLTLRNAGVDACIAHAPMSDDTGARGNDSPGARSRLLTIFRSLARCDEEHTGRFRGFRGMPPVAGDKDESTGLALGSQA